MTKFMVLDTETSGIFDFKLPADDPTQPRLAAATIILLDSPEAEPREYGFMVKPDGWEMTAEASEVNGLTTEMLLAGGNPVAHVLDFYEAQIRAGYHMAAYNAQFDGKMMRGEFRRAGRDDLFELTPNVCLMRAMMSAMKGQRPAGSKGFPKLAEAAAFVGHTIEAPHQDLGRGDARAALAVLRWLHSTEQLPEARIHYAAKGKPEA
jgi:DNA polymerase III subunit epsilon